MYRWSLEESFDYRNKLEVHQHVDGIDTYVIKKKKSNENRVKRGPE